MKILIAEDDDTSRLVLSATLTKLGYTVKAVNNGRSAWEAWQEDELTIVISDWMMPELDGLELCRMIRSQHRLHYTYVILLTALGGKGSYLNGMQSGADDLITKPFDQELLAARLQVAERILALHEALRMRALFDELTGIWNRSAIMEQLHLELNRAARTGGSTGVMVADLDRFKHINDTYGHLGGDAVLREAARRMESSLRSYDRIGRYGGEEFLIVVPNCTSEVLRMIAERIRERVKERPVQTPGGETPVTTSIGAALARGEPGESADALIGAADEALYRAKNGGRDRVELADPAAPGLPSVNASSA